MIDMTAIIEGLAYDTQTDLTETGETAADGHRENWRELAACRHTEPELFFPTYSGDLARSQVECARAICAACPVRRECLRYALLTRQTHGIWGGIEMAPAI